MKKRYATLAESQKGIKPSPEVYRDRWEAVNLQWEAGIRALASALAIWDTEFSRKAFEKACGIEKGE